MKKMPREIHPSQPEFASGSPASTTGSVLLEVLVDTERSLRELVVRSGLQVLHGLLEHDRTRLCGPRHRPHPDRDAYRHGHDEGELVLGGRKIRVTRVRSADGSREVPLPTWEQMSRLDPLEDRVMEQILVGVSTRNYERSLEPLPAGMKSRGTRRSSVSRHFVARTQAQVSSFLSRRLEDERYPVLMIDGKVFGDHLLVVILGIGSDGKKDVLGVAEGSTESGALCKRLLSDLVDRGLVIEQPRLLVIDGSKGLRKAIREVLGSWALVQRCQVHKLRNVLEHLPKSKQGWVRSAMRRAYEHTNFLKALGMPERLAERLENDHPGAAESLREGLKETLTVTDLGLEGALKRTLHSTNPIENVQGSLDRNSKNVKRWRSGKMALRWAVTGALEAQKRFRRIRGHKNMPQLLTVLETKIGGSRVDNEKAVA